MAFILLIFSTTVKKLKENTATLNLLTYRLVSHFPDLPLLDERHVRERPAPTRQSGSREQQREKNGKFRHGDSLRKNPSIRGRVFKPYHVSAANGRLHAVPALTVDHRVSPVKADV